VSAAARIFSMPPAAAPAAVPQINKPGPLIVSNVAHVLSPSCRSRRRSGTRAHSCCGQLQEWPQRAFSQYREEDRTRGKDDSHPRGRRTRRAFKRPLPKKVGPTRTLRWIAARSRSRARGLLKPFARNAVTQSAPQRNGLKPACPRAPVGPRWS
jgi:hypothetical protein